MAVQVKIPSLGDSVTEAILGTWIATDGATVAVDEAIFELESDKANMEIAAESAGVLKILKAEGETVAEGDVVAEIDPAGASATPAKPASGSGATAAEPASGSAASDAASGKAAPKTTAAGATPPAASEAGAAPQAAAGADSDDAAGTEPFLSPSVRRVIEEEGLDPNTLAGTGPGGRITKGDALEAARARASAANAPAGKTAPAAPAASDTPAARSEAARRAPAPAGSSAPREERRVRMSRMRQVIARRLVDAQRTAAILTTFNEVDLTEVMALRSKHKESFREKHGVGLGFMSFFAKACCAASRRVPEINAEIQGDEIVYRDAVHMGIAVGTPKGLVVPVVKDCDLLSFAEIESEIGRLAAKGRDGKLGIDDLAGATFTISNGGVYGSLLSTPILNPPQSGILGMHKIEKRPIVVNDEIVIRPMMYLALSYDHRIVDGEGAVTFLVAVKDALEDPARLLLEV